MRWIGWIVEPLVPRLNGWEDLNNWFLQLYCQSHRSRPSLWRVRWRLRTWSCSPDRQRASCPWHNRRSSSPRTLCGCDRWTSTCLADNCWTSFTLFYTLTKAKMVLQKQVFIHLQDLLSLTHNPSKQSQLYFLNTLIHCAGAVRGFHCASLTLLLKHHFKYLSTQCSTSSFQQASAYILIMEKTSFPLRSVICTDYLQIIFKKKIWMLDAVTCCCIVVSCTK